MAADRAPRAGTGRPEGLRLPRAYRENPLLADQGDSFWADGAGASDPRFQEPVYRWARQIVRRLGVDGREPRVVDVGCGTGDKLARVLAPVASVVGVDGPDAIPLARSRHPGVPFVSGDLDESGVWDDVAAGGPPDLVLCADVVEHVADPAGLLRRIAGLCGASGTALVSTPDRSRLEGADPLGPPANPRHVREWAVEEMEGLLRDQGLEVLEQRHLLPRRYSATVAEARRLVGRARRRLPVPDPRSCMAFHVRPAARG